MVTTPQEIALIDVVKAISMFKKVEIPILGVVENMSYYVCPACGHHDEIFARGGGQAAGRGARHAFLGEVPIDAKVRHGGDSGRPVVVGAPESEHAKLFMDAGGEGGRRAGQDQRTGRRHGTARGGARSNSMSVSNSGSKIGTAVRIDEKQLLADLARLGKIGAAPTAASRARRCRARTPTRAPTSPSACAPPASRCATTKSATCARAGAIATARPGTRASPGDDRLAPRLGAVGRHARRAARRRRRGVCARGARRGAASRRERPLEVIVFVGEEGSRFRRGTIGSAAMSGDVSRSPAILALRRSRRRRLSRRARHATAIRRARIAARRAARAAIHAFVELHVEQGGVLEAADLPIGAVTAIAGLVQRSVTFLGDANHAGATPMDLRHDALLAAAEWALGVERAARERRRRRRRHRRQARRRARAARTSSRGASTPSAICARRRPAALDAIDDYVVSSLHGIGDARGRARAAALAARRAGADARARHQRASSAAPRAAGLRVAACRRARSTTRCTWREICAVVDDLRAVDRRQVALPQEDTAPAELENGCRVLAHTLAILAG